MASGAVLDIGADTRILPGSLGRTCKRCGHDHWMYMKWKNGNHGQRCAKCAAVLTKKWKLQNPEKYREWSWRERGINITIKEYNERYEQQGGRCAICGCKRHKFVVDHCHETGKVRGLLCRRCNVLAQDESTLRMVLEYVKGGGIRA